MNSNNKGVLVYHSTIILIIVVFSHVDTLAQEYLISDFQVNEIFAKYDYGNFVNSKLIMRYDGSFILVWENRFSHNDHHGYSNIFVQLFDSNGRVLGPIIKVNDNEKVSASTHPNVAVNNAGNFVIVWQDYRWSDFPEERDADIYIQRFDRNGQALGPNIQINDNLGNDDHETPLISMDRKGTFIIVWMVSLNDSEIETIYMQRFDDAGNFLDSNEKVATGRELYNFDIALNDEGGLVIAWEIYKGHNEINAKRYDSFGQVIGSAFRVSDDDRESYKYKPKVSINRNGYFMIVWEQSVGINAKAYDNTGTARGADFRVDNQVSGKFHEYPVVGSDSFGNFIIVWYLTDQDDNRYLYAQSYDSTGTALGTQIKVNESPNTVSYNSANVTLDTNGNLLIYWETMGGNPKFLAQRYNSHGTKIGSNFYLLTINPGAGRSDQKCPAIGVSGNGNFLFAWEDTRNDNMDIFSQRFDENGLPVASNIIVNDEAADFNHQYDSRIAVNDKGNEVIVWRDYRNKKAEIYAQRFDAAGAAIGSNFRIDDDPARSWKNKPDIGMDEKGNFLVVWQDYRNQHSDIYAQRFDANGNVVEANFKVNDDAGSTFQYAPGIAMDVLGNSIVVWQDKRNGDSEIYFQRYDTYGFSKGANVKMNIDSTNKVQLSPVIDIDQSGNFVIAWMEQLDDSYEICVQRFNVDGIAFGANIRVTTLSVSNLESSLALGVDNDSRFVVAWQEDRNDFYDIYGQLYDNKNAVISPVFKINQDRGKDSPLKPAIVFKHGRLYSTWSNKENPETDWDIFANVISFEITGVNSTVATEIPTNHALLQNYPNPFNPVTRIKFALPKATHVRITVHDILGREIKDLMDEFKPAGFHLTVWDGKNSSGTETASGIYFYKLVTEYFVQVKKMVKIK